ncbi:MAG: response regulator [Vicinamibacterales bacterium]
MGDDETLIRWALGQRLSRDGHVVSEAVDGAAVLDLLAVVPPPTVVVLDVKLPDMSGLAVLEEIRKRRPDAAVLMMTAYWAGDALVQARQLGAQALLGKPLDLDRVASAVDEALTGSRTGTT